MKKNLTKLLALMMALALVFSLAACGGDPAEEESTGPSNAVVGESDTDAAVPDESNTDPSNTDPSAEGSSETAAPGESEKDTQAANEPSTAKPSGDSNTDQKLPTDKTALMNMFNAAKFSKVLMSRALTSGKVNALRVIEIDLSGEQAVKDAFKKTNTSIKVDSTKLTSVASASASGTMKSGTITFNLANVPATKATTLKHGANGYLYFIDLDEAQTVANDILGALNLGDCEVKGDKSTIALSGGKIVATVQNGKVVKATLSFTETVVASATYKLLPATATIAGSGTVVFS